MSPVVAVTGASGTVGREVVSACASRGLRFIGVRHSAPLERVPWLDVTHVVHCAGVIPSATATAAQFWDGNVGFVTRLLPWLAGKHVLHFGTSSVFFRVGAYQVSKAWGEQLLHANSAALASLTVCALPTLDDEALVAGLAARAERGERPVVSALRYPWCAPTEVARFAVEQFVLGREGTLQIEVRALAAEVRRRTGAPFEVGPAQDRTCARDGFRVASDEARESFVALFGG